MKNDKIEISKVEIKIAGEVLKLTLQQARELKGILNDTFPEPSINISYPVYVRPYTQPYISPLYPSWTCSTSTLGIAGNSALALEVV